MDDSAATVSHAPIERDMPCGRCGYNLRGLPRDGACPECGLSIPQLFEPLPAEDAAWLKRVMRGIGLFCFPVVFGSKLIMAPLWDFALALLVLAVLTAVSIWMITARKPGASAEDPLAWKQRAARAAAVGLPIAFTLQVLNHHWYWAGMPPALSRAVTGAVPLTLAIGMLVSLDYLCSVADGFAPHQVTGALRKLAWALSISFLLTPLWVLFVGEQGPRILGLNYLWSAVFIAYAITATVTLLLLGQLLERSKQAIEGRSPVEGRPPTTKSSHYPRPATPLGWGIVLLSFLPAEWLGTGRLMFYLGPIALGLWLAGGWIISRNLRATLSEQRRRWMSSLFYACAVIAAASQLVWMVLRLCFGQPISADEPTAVVSSVSSSFYFVADVGCVWLVLGMLRYKAESMNAGMLSQCLHLSRWAITVTLLVHYSGAEHMLGRAIEHRFGLVRAYTATVVVWLVLLLLLTYAVILWGRLWHAIETQPMDVDAPSAAPQASNP